MNRIHVCGGGLRALLLADIARRTADVAHGRGVVVTSAFTDPDAAALNIYPPDDITAGHPDGATLVGCAHHRDCVVVGSLEIGVVDLGGAKRAGPLALRLALLETDHREPAAIDAATLEATDAALSRWRSAMATWARSPGAPMSRPHANVVVAALDDLMLPQAVAKLREIESENQLPPGAMFETFAYLDRILGLDLARDLGR